MGGGGVEEEKENARLTKCTLTYQGQQTTGVQSAEKSQSKANRFPSSRTQQNDEFSIRIYFWSSHVGAFRNVGNKQETRKPSVQVIIRSM